MSLDLLFTNQSSASAAQTSSFVQDAFVDITLPATNNSGLTDSISVNPTQSYFANDNSAKFGPKTLFIKSISLLEDRTKWVNNLPTYLITWHEDYPGVVGYVFGHPSGEAVTKRQVFSDSLGSGFQRTCVTVGIGNALGEGLGVTFKGRRVSFLVEPYASTTYDGKIYTDNVAGTTYSVNNAAVTDFRTSTNTQQDLSVPHYVPLPHAAANETDNIHDFQIRSQVNPLSFTGVVVYWENSGSNIEISQGTNYVNKNQVVSSVGTTMSLPVAGSSIGGNALFYQISGGGYTTSVVGPSYISSVAQGSSGTNLLNVTTGHGSRFASGYGVIVNQGSSNYVGSITQVSTDTLTVSPTLPFGITNSIYVAWQSSPTLSISSTLMEKVGSIDFGAVSSSYRATNTIQQLFDPNGKWAFFQSGFVRSFPSGNLPTIIGLTTTTGAFLQVDGRFSAMEVETLGTGVFHATCFINGKPSWGLNTGTTAGSKWTLFSNAGPGLNSAALYFGTSHALSSSLGISKINFYQIAKDPGITYGLIASIPINQAFVDAGTVNSTLVSPGTFQRIYSDLSYASPNGSGSSYWINANASNGLSPLYNGYSGGIMDFYFYGKNYALGGTLTGGSFILQLDGISVGSTFNVWQSAASEGFHKVEVQVKTSGPAVSFLDISRTNDEIKSLRNYYPLKPSNESSAKKYRTYIWASGGNGHGATNTKVRLFSSVNESVGADAVYTSSAASGSAFLILSEGNYTISYSDARIAGQSYQGISIATPTWSGTTSTNTLTYAQGSRGVNFMAGGNQPHTLSVELPLMPGDIVYPHDDGTNESTDANIVYFTICRSG